MISLTIDGRAANGAEGKTVFDLAGEMGVPIPSLCHDPCLAPYGACRVCLVEDERTGALLASCVTPISQGMKIRTDSPRVLETRRMVVKLMLAGHPESCLVCDKGNRCRLRQVAADLGIGFLELDKLPQYTGTQEVNPFIQRDLSKCILCGKCIRADHELVAEGAIDYFHRGFDARPATLHDGPLEKSECTFCGACVDLCPTGALAERGQPARSTAARSVASVCPYCACGCALRLGVSGRQVVAAGPDRARAPQSSPALCVRGHYGWDFIHSGERLKAPLIRREGKLTECSWAEALDFAAGEISRIGREHGPGRLAFLGSARCTNEENYLFQRLARAGAGTNNIDHGSPLGGLPSPGAFGPEWGWGALSAPLADIEEARGILVMGAGPEETAPVAAYKIKRAVNLKGARLFLAEARRTRLAPFASSWLRPRPGSEWALALGLLRAVLESGGKNQGEEAAAWWEGVKPFDLGRVEAETGVEGEKVQSLAAEFSRSGPGAIVLGGGLWQGPQGSLGLAALMNLALLTGSAARFYPLGRDCNGQGARDMGALPDFLPGYHPVGDEAARRRFQEAWGKPLPAEKGLSAGEMFVGAEQGRVRGMYLMGENPARSFPETSRVRGALGKLEFLAVQDLFLTETAGMAHLVLPACGFAEKEGTLTGMERRVQLLRAASEPLGESLPDWKILTEVSRRLGLGKDFSSPGEIMGEIGALVPLYGGITHRRLEERDLFWPCLSPKDPGRARLRDNGGPSEGMKTIPLSAALSRKAGEGKGGAFRLVVGPGLFHFGSGTRSEKSPRLSRFPESAALRMNPQDAAALNLEEGCRVRVRAKGREMSFRLSLDRSLPPHTLFLPLTAAGREGAGDFITLPSPPEAGFSAPPFVEVNLERMEP